MIGGRSRPQAILPHRNGNPFLTVVEVRLLPAECQLTAAQFVACPSMDPPDQVHVRETFVVRTGKPKGVSFPNDLILAQPIRVAGTFKPSQRPLSHKHRIRLSNGTFIQRAQFAIERLT